MLSSYNKMWYHAQLIFAYFVAASGHARSVRVCGEACGN